MTKDSLVRILSFAAIGASLYFFGYYNGVGAERAREMASLSFSVSERESHDYFQIAYGVILFCLCVDLLATELSKIVSSRLVGAALSGLSIVTLAAGLIFSYLELLRWKLIEVRFGIGEPAVYWTYLVVDFGVWGVLAILLAFQTSNTMKLLRRSIRRSDLC
ncbi:MAG: hypothetical protein R2682_00610 [Pyrinomonadaceae bacterium]